MGFQNKSIEVTNAAATVFKLDPNNSLDEVVVTGNRSKVRSVLNSVFLLISCMLKTLSLVAR
jgi:iron complex outermembrane receptor protein